MAEYPFIYYYKQLLKSYFILTQKVNYTVNEEAERFPSTLHKYVDPFCFIILWSVGYMVVEIYTTECDKILLQSHNQLFFNGVC